MIWATAKSTLVSSRQSPWPSRAGRLSPPGRRDAAEIAAGVAMAGTPAP
jgi:hypothetical protein